MVGSRSLGSMEKGGYGTSVSFDIDDAPVPKRRSSKERKDKQVKQDVREGIDCPGCGNELEESEWVDALVGFVSGAKEFEMGNPVRARIVQTLRNEATRMETPSPHENWEISVVERLLKEIDRIVEAEINRQQMKIDSDDVNRELMLQEAMIQAEQTLRPILEIEIRQQVSAEILQQIEVEIRQQVETETRQQVEAELWSQFEEILREKTGASQTD